VFAALAGSCFLLLRGSGPALRIGLYLGAAAVIQLRLLCNLLDGLLAVEWGRGGRSGLVFNDLPDRFSDIAILVPAGYSLTWVAWGPELGWSAGLLAVLTAYVRLLGGSAGLPQDFSGPMAKPHRMAVVTVACLLGALSWHLRWRWWRPVLP
jgi:phosphatidylglycerophosphate synthase